MHIDPHLCTQTSEFAHSQPGLLSDSTLCPAPSEKSRFHNDGYFYTNNTIILYYIIIILNIFQIEYRESCLNSTNFSQPYFISFVLNLAIDCLIPTHTRTVLRSQVNKVQLRMRWWCWEWQSSITIHIERLVGMEPLILDFSGSSFHLW